MTYDDHVVELDPRWEWAEVRELCSVSPRYVRSHCRHTELVPVESSGEVVARLCLTCDAQLRPEKLHSIPGEKTVF